MKDLSNKIVAVGVVIILLAGVGVGSLLQSGDTPLGGFASRASTFLETSTSSVLTITTDTQILATSSRIYAKIVNNCAVDVYITENADEPANTSTGWLLKASGGSYESNIENLYVGAMRASSTNETACELYVSEYKSR